MMSSTLIGWLITIAFVLILVAGFLIGFWRGLKRSTVNLIISIAGVLIAFFVTPAITNAILGIKITVDGTQTTLQNAVVEILRSDNDINAMMIANKNLEVFFSNLPKALFNVVVFIVVTMIIEGLLYIVYKILAVTCLKRKEDEKKRAALGGIVGLVKTFVVVLFAFMPLASLTGVANNLMKQSDYGIAYTTDATVQESNSILEDKLPKGIKNLLVGLENNMLTKTCGIFGLDNAMFDYYSSFEVGGEKVSVREEVDNHYKVIDFVYQISNANLENINYLKLRYDKIQKAIEDTTNSTLFKKIVSQTLADVILNYEDYSFTSDLSQDVVDVLEDIKTNLQVYADAGEEYKYFQNDLVNTVDALRALGQSGIINDVIDMPNSSFKDIAIIITSDENEQALETAIRKILDINIVRSCVVEIAQKGLEDISTELDQIGVSTDDWTDQIWQEVSDSVVNIINDFGDISSQVDVFEVLEDPTILLDETKNYDIKLITSKLGNMIDEIRANQLLETSDGSSIIDSLLEKHNVTLPTEQVENSDGSLRTINNYTEYFDFIQPSLTKLQENGFYDIINNLSLTMTEKMTKIAELIEKDENHDLLSEIIIPLYQVEPTKSIIVENLTTNLQSDLVDFSVLANLDDWSEDLTYLSDMLLTLNSLNAGEDTLLALALEGNVDSIIDNLKEEDVEKVLKSILYAKTTAETREKIFTNIKSRIDDVTGLSCTLSSVTLNSNSAEDQAKEICNALNKLIAVNDAFDEGATITTIDKQVLGELLNTMKENAYRVEIYGKTETGIFNNAFVNLMTKLKTEYQTEISYIEESETILAELKVDSLGEENYSKINYLLLLAKIEEIKNM